MKYSRRIVSTTRGGSLAALTFLGSLLILDGSKAAAGRGFLLTLPSWLEVAAFGRDLT